MTKEKNGPVGAATPGPGQSSCDTTSVSRPPAGYNTPATQYSRHGWDPRKAERIRLSYRHDRYHGSPWPEWPELVLPHRVPVGADGADSQEGYSLHSEKPVITSRRATRPGVN